MGTIWTHDQKVNAKRSNLLSLQDFAESEGFIRAVSRFFGIRQKSEITNENKLFRTPGLPPLPCRSPVFPDDWTLFGHQNVSVPLLMQQNTIGGSLCQGFFERFFA